MTTRRDAMVMMVGGMLAATSGRMARAADTNAAGDPTLPELMKSVMPMMGQTPVKAEPLAPGLRLVTGPGGNITVLDGPDGLILGDSFVPGHVAAIMAALGKPTGQPITLIDTHWHFDHAGGNAEFGKLGARIVAHSNARARLAAPQVMSDFGMNVPAEPAVALPVVTFDDKLTMHQNGQTIRLTAVPPAHTDGDVFIHYEQANVLQTGDLFSNGFYPNIDRNSGGWIGGMVAAADVLLGLVDAKTKIVPGHGPLATKADLKAARDMLAEVQALIEPLVKAGKTVDEAVAARPLARLDPIWGKGLFKGSHFTTLVYNGLVDHHKEVAAGKAKA